MRSKVYFADLKCTSKSTNLYNKIRRLYDLAEFSKIVYENALTAIKIHFGEKGNTGYINPVFVRQVVDKIKEGKGKPFLTDTNTLYYGSRSNSVDHIVTAIENGFAYAVVNAPIIIADGLFSKNYVEVEINKKHFKSVKIASDIYNADCMIVLSHFKGHEMAGFGGAIKNLAMGCASAAGKQMQHSTIKPKPGKKCVGCGICTKWCPKEAIAIVDGKAHIDEEKCIGCGECISVCLHRAINPQWGTDINDFMERMVEYAYGAVKNKEGKVGYMNFIMNVTPLCDCTPWSDAAIVPDIGILASLDPVALDQACYDLVNEAVSLRGHNEKDKFRAIHEEVDPTIQLRYAEEIGLGSREYELIKI